MSRVFVNGLSDQGSIPGRVIPKTQKMLLDATLLKVRIKGSGAIQGMKWRPPLHLGVVAIVFKMNFESFYNITKICEHRVG